jgi:hypothetical protein
MEPRNTILTPAELISRREAFRQSADATAKEEALGLIPVFNKALIKTLENHPYGVTVSVSFPKELLAKLSYMTTPSGYYETFPEHDLVKNLTPVGEAFFEILNDAKYNYQIKQLGIVISL